MLIAYFDMQLEAVAGPVCGKEKPPLQDKEHPRSPASVLKTPLCSPLQAKTFHIAAAHSLPPLPATSPKAALAWSVQHAHPC